MRISSLTLYNSSLSDMQVQQNAIARLSRQIASGQRLLATKDDPIAGNRVLELTDRIALRSQYASNQLKAELSLKYEATVTQEIRKVLTDARALLRNISPSHDPNTRTQLSANLMATYNHLKALVNTQDPSGNYIFAGFETATSPYAHTQVAPDTDNNPATAASSGATTYSGTTAPAGTRSVLIDANRSLQVNDNLQTVMLNIDVQTASTNTGNAKITTTLSSTGTIPVDSDYTLSFNAGAYTLTRQVDGASVAVIPGTPILIGGVDQGFQVNLASGAPNNGDTWTIHPTDILRRFDQAALDLRENAGPGLLQQSGLNNAVSAIDAALSNLGVIEERVAAAQTELTDTQTTTRTLLNTEQSALNDILGLDQAAAIVELQRRQTALQAAQQTFSRIAGMSLFNYL